MSNKIYEVLLVNNHSLIHEYLHKQLDVIPMFTIVEATHNEKEVWEKNSATNPDMCIFNIEMSIVDMIEVTQMIKSNNPSIFITLLTLHSKPWIEDKEKNVNANCILLKCFIFKELQNTINLLVENGLFYTPEIEKFFTRKSQKLTSKQSFSKRELEILKLIGDGLTSRKIAEKLYLSENTIETYRKNLLSKLEASNMANLIKKAIELRII